MKYKEIYNTYVEINEVFDKSLDYDLAKTNNTQWSGSFNFEDYRFKVLFKEVNNVWDIWFFPIDSKYVDLSVFDWTKEFLNNKRTSLIIFSTVIKMIKDWVKRENPLIFAFRAEEKRREKLYQKIIQFLRIEKKLKGYSLVRIKNEWVFTRKKEFSNEKELLEYEEIFSEFELAFAYLVKDKKIKK